MEDKILTLVEMFWSEAKRRGLEVSYPTVTFDLKGATSGQAITSYNGINKLRFNVPLLSRVTEDEVYQTVGHECVHIFANRKYKRNCAHGILWKSEMIAYGLAPKRCHNYDVTGLMRRQNRLTYSCACGKMYSLSTTVVNKIKRGQVRVCRTCRAEVKI